MNKRELKGDSLLTVIDSYVVIDIETTGYDPSKDKIIEVGAIRVEDNKIVEEFRSLINPEIEIDDFIVNLTGITNEMVVNAPTIDQVLEEYVGFIGQEIIIGHNVNFDINFIYDRYMESFNKPLQNDFIDTLRLARKYCKTDDHKLSTLVKHFGINTTGEHRSLADCYSAHGVYERLKELVEDEAVKHQEFINNTRLKVDNVLAGKKVVIQGAMVLLPRAVLVKVIRKSGIKIHQHFYGENYDVIILSYRKYENYISQEDNFYKDQGCEVLSEFDLYDMLGLDYNKEEIIKSKKKTKKAKDFVAENDIDESNPFFGKECVVTGTLEKMTRAEFMQLIVNLGGHNRDTVTKDTRYLILGDNTYRLKGKKSSKQVKAEKNQLSGQNIEIISESVFYDMLEDYVDF